MANYRTLAPHLSTHLPRPQPLCMPCRSVPRHYFKHFNGIRAPGITLEEADKAADEPPAEPSTPLWVSILASKEEQQRYSDASAGHLGYLLTYDLDESGVVLVGSKTTAPTEPFLVGVGLLVKKLVRAMG